MRHRLVFVTSHPIQYQVPVFRQLAAMPELDFIVLFAMLPNAESQGRGFGIEFEWDIPLLDGYQYRVLENVSKSPGVTEYRGCDTPGLIDTLREIRPQSVIVNGWVVKSCLQALWACKRLGIPCVVRGESNDLAERATWKRLLQRLLVRQYTACLYIGLANRDFYCARGVPENRLFPAPYCIENERFEQAVESLEGQAGALRRGWQIPESSVCYLYCGKFEGKKHPLELLEAFGVAFDHQKGIHLLMVGDGDLRAQCERYALAHRLPVSFAGFLNQSQIVKAYVAADCLVLPSDAGETWGLVVNEAMACGLPAIVSDRVGCARDLVQPGRTGFVVPFGHWGTLADQLGGLGDSRTVLEQMGRSANEVVQAYSPKIAAEGMLEAVLWACRKSR